MRAKRRANLLEGKAWTRYSISVWSDIKKSKEEARLRHPALFPEHLCERLIKCFAAPEDEVILDPFAGLGSTVLAAHKLGKTGIGVDLSADFVLKAQERLGEPCDKCRFLCADARGLSKLLPAESVDLVITSPPYWDILTRRRSADRKPPRHYGESDLDLGRIASYPAFLRALRQVFAQVHQLLRPGKYCLAVVMDLRKSSTFFPFHADFAAMMQETGFLFDDLIIWDRRAEYNNLRPLGFPSVFRINKVHEYILIFQKPREMATSRCPGSKRAEGPKNLPDSS
jgi:DNA modification methylase